MKKDENKDSSQYISPGNWPGVFEMSAFEKKKIQKGYVWGDCSKVKEIKDAW